MHGFARTFCVVGVAALVSFAVGCSSTSEVSKARYHIVSGATEQPFGYSMKQWGIRYATWYMAMPRSRNPLWDSASPETNQAPPVWFLGSTLDTTSGNHPEITRSVTLPSNVHAVFVGISGYEVDTTDGVPRDSLALVLRKKWQEGVSGASGDVTIDTDPQNSILENVIDTTFLLTIPEQNVHGPQVHACTAPAALIGVYVMIDSLAQGSHTIHMHGGNQTFQTDILYHLNVQ
jgi:hypothetical protein